MDSQYLVMFSTVVPNLFQIVCNAVQTMKQGLLLVIRYHSQNWTVLIRFLYTCIRIDLLGDNRDFDNKRTLCTRYNNGSFKLSFVIGSPCILNLDISKSKAIISIYYSFVESNPLIKSSFNSLIFSFISTHEIVKWLTFSVQFSMGRCFAPFYHWTVD